MKLVLFCDYGLDGAAATVDALLHSEEDGYEEVVLAAIGGSVPPSISLRNAIRLVSGCDFSHSPITIVDTTEEDQPFEFLASVQGGDGMGNLFEDGPFHAKVVPFDRWLNAFSGGYRLLSLGPMTLTVKLLQKCAPEQFVLLGGNVAAEPNFQGCEFNQALDPVAFQEAVKYAHAAVTLDSCQSRFLQIGQEGIGGQFLLERIVSRARELALTSGKKEFCLSGDIALKLLRHPNWFMLRYGEDEEGNGLTYAEYVHGEEYLKLLEL